MNFRADQPDLDERVAEVVSRGVRLVSFAGAPTRDAVARCHDAGVAVMPTVGARRHAEKVLEMGVEALVGVLVGAVVLGVVAGVRRVLPSRATR